MPKFDFKPGDEAYIVQKHTHRVEGPYRVAGIRRGGANGPQALLYFRKDIGPEPTAHTDPENVFHDRESARLFALSLVDTAIVAAKIELEALEKERAVLLKEPKYSVGQAVWVTCRYDGRCVEGPFVIESTEPYDDYVLYRLKMDAFPYHRTESEKDLYPTKDEAKAVAIKQAAECVAEAQRALDRAKAREREIVDG